MPQLLLDFGASHVPRLQDYFGLWLYQEQMFMSAVEHVRRMNLPQHILNTEPPQQAQTDFVTHNTQRVAVVPLVGTLMKGSSSLGASTSTVRTRREIRNLGNDPDVAAIMLHVDSPGGTAAGTQDLADEVAIAARKKPVGAFIEDLGASAAYWISSQVSPGQLSANPSALVGSIGTFMAVMDLSKMAEMEGVKVHVLSTGPFKGAGVPGAEITEPQLEYFQGLVNDLQEHFSSAVASGRDLSKARVKELADGRVHIAANAKSLGLIDSIGTFEEAINRLASGNRRKKMAAATIAELKEACPDASSDFLCSQLEAESTVEVAQKAYMQLLIDQNKKKTAETVDDSAIGEGKAKGKIGSGDFDSAVRELVAKGLTRKAAISQVRREDPEAHKAYLLDINSGKREAVATIKDRL